MPPLQLLLQQQLLLLLAAAASDAYASVLVGTIRCPEWYGAVGAPHAVATCSSRHMARPLSNDAVSVVGLGATKLIDVRHRDCLVYRYALRKLIIIFAIYISGKIVNIKIVI